MSIKHSIMVRFFKYKSSNLHQIRFRVNYSGYRVEFSTGCTLEDISFWDKGMELVKMGYYGKNGEDSMSINKKIREAKEHVEFAFKFFEVNNIFPTKAELSAKIQERIIGTTPIKPTPKEKEKKEKPKEPVEPNFFVVYDEFMNECGEKNAWTDATFEKMLAMRTDLMTFKKNIKFSDLTEKTLTNFVIYLRDKKVLHTPRKAKDKRDINSTEDLIGLKNSTIHKKLVLCNT